MLQLQTKLAIFAFAIFSLPFRHSFAQTNHDAPPLKRSEQTISIGGFGWLTLRNPVNVSVQGTKEAVGVAAAYHQQIRPLVGYKVNFGWTRTSEVYKSQSSGTVLGKPYVIPLELDVPVKVVELSGTYVVEQRPNSSKLRAFGELGPGVLMFLPKGVPFEGHSSFRAAAVFGGGAMFQASKRLELQVEYRSYFYKNPDFTGDIITQVPRGKFFTFTSGPAIAVSYRFR